jgi:class 3 adenylate cyclase/pimeloyl-ACP methyl ester carboxylesterase
MMEQHIQFVTAPDGVNLAVATLGSGPPLILVPGWLSHLELDWHDPFARSLFERLASERQLIRYDKRGTGLSDRGIGDHSLDAQVRDLEAIVDQLQLRRIALLGYCQGGPISISYATLHPQNVCGLILYASYCSGRHWREATPGLRDALASLIRADWGGYGATTMLDMFVPGAPPELRQQFAEYQRQSATAEDAVSMLETLTQYEVTPLLSQIATPTLVLHRRDDRASPFQQGRDVASRIRGARFMPLEGDIHVIWLGDTEPIITAIDHFLSGYEGSRPPPPVREGLQSVFFTDVEGSTMLTQRLGDARAREVLREHERITREALKAHGGAEVKAMGDGFMASFSSATRALECAIAIQRAFAEWNADVGAQGLAPLRIRIGINAGEPIAEAEDLFGTAVNMAARIAAQAEGGEILVANVVRELAAGKRFLFSDRGEVVLRGFEDPVRLYEVRWREGE